MFWRKKINQGAQAADEKSDRVIHHPSDPAIAPSLEYDAEPDAALVHTLNETEAEVIDDLADLPEQSGEAMPLFAAPPVVQIARDESSRDDDAGGWFSRLSAGLTKSTLKIGQGITDLVAKKKLDAGTLAALEDILIAADLGPKTAAKVIARIRDKSIDRDMSETEIRILVADEIARILEVSAKPLVIKRPDQGPFVMLVAGVNGAGKTTTIGKMAKIMHDRKHHKVMLVAGDTFRAAAVEQLQIWGTRAHCPVVTRDIGADAAALAFESYDQARRDGIEVMIVDTAGRLHNKSNLMDELKKIVRVLKKHDENLPHEVLLVLDGTTGQNAFAQVETFKNMVDVTGLIVTKLDGSAKGGVVVGLADQFGLPIYAVGVGEGVDDLQPFTAQGYARALMGVG